MIAILWKRKKDIYNHLKLHCKNFNDPVQQRSPTKIDISNHLGKKYLYSLITT